MMGVTWSDPCRGWDSVPFRADSPGRPSADMVLRFWLFTCHQSDCRNDFPLPCRPTRIPHTHWGISNATLVVRKTSSSHF